MEKDDVRTAATPGLPESADDAPKDEEERDKVGSAPPPVEETDHRGGAGAAQFLAGDRLDLKSPVKEVLRDGAKPRESSVQKMKRIARYVSECRDS